MAMKLLSFLLLAAAALTIATFAQEKQQDHPNSRPEEGFGRVHMDTSCSPSVAADFDRALALLHNFWYVRALERFNEIELQKRALPSLNYANPN